MFPLQDDWSEPTENDAEQTPATLEELLERIRQKSSQGLTPVEELRLLIATRRHQTWPPQASEAELISMGFDSVYASEMVHSTLTSGQFGWVEHSVSGDGFYWKNPTFETKRQLARRAGELDGKARRLAAQAPHEPPPPVVELPPDAEWPAAAKPPAALSAPKMRFVPAQCPGCDAPVAAAYSQYRRGRRSIAFRVLLAAGILVVGALLLVSFWGTFALTYELLAQAGLRKREIGLVSLLAFLCTLPLIFVVWRVWWRRIHRLPLTFAYECPTCHWTGSCGAKEMDAEF